MSFAHHAVSRCAGLSLIHERGASSAAHSSAVERFNLVAGRAVACLDPKPLCVGGHGESRTAHSITRAWTVSV